MRIFTVANVGNPRSGKRLRPLLAVPFWILAFPVPTSAADLSEAVQLYKSGKYAECIKLTGLAIQEGELSETWRVLRIQSQLAVGSYANSAETLELALRRYPYSIRLRWLGRDVYRFHGQEEAAEKLVQEIAELAGQASWRYRDPLNLLILGRFFLDQGTDAKQVLDGIYDKVKRQQPRLPHAFIASGQLSLEKHDYGLAAAEFEQAAKLDRLDPEIQYGLARAYAPSDSDKATAALNAALRLNPKHVPSLLLAADQQIDAEQYDEAEKTLQQVLNVHNKHPLAWSYRAILAHLDNNGEAEREAHGKAISTWRKNPEVDYLIGLKLSQKYRFQEGAAYQRQALAMDPDYSPAKIQLSQDLLRLGVELEGWQLASEVLDADPYNVVAHNLSTLRDRLNEFTLLEGDGFLVRMDAAEAKIYGRRVLELLGRAKLQLCPKYGVQLEDTVFVDIYPRQQDFAIRTFGLPGGAGFLGVCFGQVITMNSPAAQGATPSNWQSVLWHEFCHVVTLSKTQNKMPRWLSEGISVYEERQADPAWGQSMNTDYRQAILQGELTPVSRLSGAFLKPPSPFHLKFAYYESALAVEYIVEKYGLKTLRRILVDLGVGMPINDSIERYAGSLQLFDQEFAAYAKRRAESLAVQADFSEPDLPRSVDTEAVAVWLKEHPHSYLGLRRYVQQLLAEERWEQAQTPLKKLLEIYPEQIGADSALATLAMVHRRLGETDQERTVLTRLAELDSDAVDVYLRLMEICSNQEDWQATLHHAEQVLAVNPLLKAPHRYLAAAAEQIGDDVAAIDGLLVLAELKPFDPADVHFRAARLLQRTGRSEQARRHVLRALEEAPRYRAAHRLLLDIVGAQADRRNQDPVTESPSTPRPQAEESQP